MGEALLGFQFRQPEVYILIDDDGIVLTGFTRDELPGSGGGVGEGFLRVSGFGTLVVRDDPDLEQVDGFVGGRIELTVLDPRAGGHVLNITGLDDATVAHGVAVLEGAGKNVRDDLHVPVGMGAEAHAGLDRVVVDDSKGSEPHPFGIVVIGEAERVACIEPSVIGVAPVLGTSDCCHGVTMAVGSGGRERFTSLTEHACEAWWRKVAGGIRCGIESRGASSRREWLFELWN